MKTGTILLSKHFSPGSKCIEKAPAIAGAFLAERVGFDTVRSIVTVQEKKHISYLAERANEGSVSPVGIAKGKRPEFVSAKGRMKPAPRVSGDH